MGAKPGGMKVASAAPEVFSDGYCGWKLLLRVYVWIGGGLEISGVVCSALRFRRKWKKIPAIIAAMSASPPMTPPTIEPTGVELFCDGLGVVGLECIDEFVVVVCDTVVSVRPSCPS